jgi:hypothetical protein
MKILHNIHIWISINKKKLSLFFIWTRVFIFYILNIKKIKNSDSYLEYRYILRNGVSCFPYSFVDQYKKMSVNVFYDDIHPYIVENNLKIYFNSNWNTDKVAKYYNEISLEQNVNSPHCYYNNNIDYSIYDIAIDIGAAEGNFSTFIVKHISKIYLYEKDDVWYDCLKRTFQPFEDKVEIIKKKVSNINDEFNVKLDSINQYYDKNILVKIDVEGNELKVLEGMEKILSQKKLITLVVCTYHKQNDEVVLNEFLSNLGYSNSYSNGYMCYFHDKNIKKPFLRKAIMYSTKLEII